MDLLGFTLTIFGYVVAAFAFWDAHRQEHRALAAEATADALSGNLEQWADQNARLIAEIRRLQTDLAERA